MAPESFVVHIYRCGGARGEDMAGVLQRMGSEQKHPFKSAQELWSLLAAIAEERGTPGYS